MCQSDLSFPGGTWWLLKEDQPPKKETVEAGLALGQGQGVGVLGRLPSALPAEV